MKAEELRNDLAGIFLVFGLLVCLDTDLGIADKDKLLKNADNVYNEVLKRI